MLILRQVWKLQTHAELLRKKSVKKKEREQIPFMIQMIIDHQLKQEGNLKKENASFVSYIL